MIDEEKTVRFDWALKRLLRHKADHTILNGFLTKEQRRDYERYIGNMRTLEDVVESAYSSGHFEGKAEGELQKAVEVAKTAINMGLDDNAISKLSGLPIEEIQKLR